jgi:hypothetical protein
MVTGIPAPLAIVLLSVCESLLMKHFTSISPEKGSYYWLITAIAVLNTCFVVLWRTLIYPSWFSPFKNLPYPSVRQSSEA